MLNDRDLVNKLSLRLPRDTETSLEAIICTLVVKAIRGDVRASEVLLKHSVDKDMLLPEGGFFSQSELKITVVGQDGKLTSPKEFNVDKNTSTIQ